MKNTYILFILYSLFINVSFSQNIQCEWIQKGEQVFDNTPGPTSRVNAMVADNNGNVYITGQFPDSIVFGNDTLLSNMIHYNMFLVKYDMNGNLIWTKMYTSSASTIGEDIKIDPFGNIVICGTLGDSISLGYNAFVMKLDNAGNQIWVKSFVSAGNDSGDKLAIDSSGNIYLAGGFLGTISFGNQTFNNSGNGDAYLVKLDSAGNPLWAKESDGPGLETIEAMTLDPNANCILSGQYQGTALFNSQSLINHDTVGATRDIFIAKYDSSGNFLWARGEGALQNDYPGGIDVDVDGNIYLFSYFQDSVISIGGTILVNPGNLNDIYIAKYDSLGNVIRAINYGGSGTQFPTDMIIRDNIIFISGSYLGNDFIFGADTLVNSPTNLFGFIATLDTSGNRLSAKSISGDYYFVGNSLCLGSNNSMYLAGWASGTTLDFDACSIGFTNPIVFVSRLNTLNTYVNKMKGSSIKVYPNPSRRFINVELHQFTDGEVLINLYSPNGKTFHSEKIVHPTGIIQIDLHDFNAGMYFMNIKGIDFNSTTKVVFLPE